MIGLGILLAIVGPLLLVPVVWLLYRFVLKPMLGSTAKALPLAIALVGAVILFTYLPGKRAFDDRCAAYGPPVVAQQVRVDGFFRTKLFMYEAVQYLAQGGFAFVEAQDPYQEGVTLRYTMGPDGVAREDEVTELRSVYGVRKTFEQQDGISKSEKVVYEIETGRELAHAAQLDYHGGPLSIFLGTMGMASCPDIRSEEGSRQFRTFYDLETIVLQSEPVP